MRATQKLLLVLLLTLTGTWLPAFAQNDDPHLADIRKAGKVTAAVASMPPGVMVSPSGEATGSLVELQNMVLKSMGLPALTPVLTDWTAMIPGLVAKQFDYQGGGLNVTEQGCKAVLFSAPQGAARSGLFVLPGNPKHLATVAEVAQRPDIKLAMVPSPGSYEGYAWKHGVKPEQIVHVPDIQAGVAAVTGGRADAYVGSQFTLVDPKKRGVELVVDEQSPVVASAFAFRKEDRAFRDAFNSHLIPLIKNGTFVKLMEKYGVEAAYAHAYAESAAKYDKASDVVPSCE